MPEATRWFSRRAVDSTPFIFNNDFDTERDQARKEKTNMIWNLDAIKTLEEMNYFKMHGIEKEIEEFKASD